MKQRNESLDALRGFAILTMVLSGSIAFGDVLPAWMFHAQVPPPTHVFQPSIPGITWVDLVFPFFLFSMGAAIPLSMQKHLSGGLLSVAAKAARRLLLLAFFALFIQHMKAWVIAESPSATDHLISIVAFILLFFQFYEYTGSRYRNLFLVLKIAAFTVAILLLWQIPFKDGKGFDFFRSDIIILVLANMAFFATIIYYLTATQPLLRLGILPFVMAFFFAGKEPVDGWAKTVFSFDSVGGMSISWLYKFYFLKYLFIIIPGTFAGEWMMRSKPSDNKSSATSLTIALLCLLLVIMNLYCLFTRMLVLNLGVTLMICLTVLYLDRTAEQTSYRKMLVAGTYLLLLGLTFEAYEGGIKKDPSTYSYYFVTSGLAFFSLVFFSIISEYKIAAGTVHYLAKNGKNPMVAYVAGSLLILPLLELTSLKQYWNAMNQDAWIGFLKGVVFTGLVSLVTVFFVQRRWFWKT